MKLTKSQLQSTIQEELQKLLQEDIPAYGGEYASPLTPSLSRQAQRAQSQAATGQARAVGAIAGGATDAASEAAIWWFDKMPKDSQRWWMDYFGSGDQGELVRDVAGLIGSTIGKGVKASRGVYEALGLPQWDRQDWENAAKTGISTALTRAARTAMQASELSSHGRVPETREDFYLRGPKPFIQQMSREATTGPAYEQRTSEIGWEGTTAALMATQLGLTLAQLTAARSAASEAMAAGAGAEDALIAAETAAAGAGASTEAVGSLRSTGAHLGKHGREQYRRGPIMDRESFAGANRPWGRQARPKPGEQLSFGEQGRMIWPRGAGDSKLGWPVSAGATARGEYMSLPTRARPLSTLVQAEEAIQQSLAPTSANISRTTAGVPIEGSGWNPHYPGPISSPPNIAYRPSSSGSGKWIPRVDIPLEKIIKEELQKLLQS